ncbi:hypothetical protein [Pantoea ananatis]|uniref:hypothetical protein n=1 Tax=Pantoea ananas TaxID=553 RepID=UPI001FF0D15E|nr:hypothetical protein [Pantoea ananatis]
MAIPKDADVKNYTGKSALPGLISDHAHLAQYQGVTPAPDAYTREKIINQLMTYQKYGVTTVMSLGVDDEFLKLMKEHGTVYIPTLGGMSLFIFSPNSLNCLKRLKSVGPLTRSSVNFSAAKHGRRSNCRARLTKH